MNQHELLMKTRENLCVQLDTNLMGTIRTTEPHSRMGHEVELAPFSSLQCLTTHLRHSRQTAQRGLRQN